MHLAHRTPLRLMTLPGWLRLPLRHLLFLFFGVCFWLFFFFPSSGFATLVYPLNSFQMGLPLLLLPSRRRHASGVRRLPIGRCRAERSICRGFGSAGCGGSFCARLDGQHSAGTWRRSQTPSGLGRPAARGAVPRAGSPDGRTDGASHAQHGRGAAAPLGMGLGEGTGVSCWEPDPMQRGAFGNPQLHSNSSGTISVAPQGPPRSPPAPPASDIAGTPPGMTCGAPAHRGEAAASASSS